MSASSSPTARKGALPKYDRASRDQEKTEQKKASKHEHPWESGVPQGMDEVARASSDRLGYFDAHCAKIDHVLEKLSDQETQKLMQHFHNHWFELTLNISNPNNLFKEALQSAQDHPDRSFALKQRQILRAIFECIRVHPLVRTSVVSASGRELAFLCALNDPFVWTHWATQSFNRETGSIEPLRVINAQGALERPSMSALADPVFTERQAQMRRASYITTLLMNLHTQNSKTHRAVHSFGAVLFEHLKKIQSSARVKAAQSDTSGEKMQTEHRRGENVHKSARSATVFDTPGGATRESEDGHIVPNRFGFVGALSRWNQKRTGFSMLIGGTVGALGSLGILILTQTFAPSDQVVLPHAVGGMGVALGVLCASVLVVRSTWKHFPWQRNYMQTIKTIYPWLDKVRADHLERILPMSDEMTNCTARSVFGHLFEPPWIGGSIHEADKENHRIMEHVAPINPYFFAQAAHLFNESLDAGMSANALALYVQTQWENIEARGTSPQRFDQIQALMERPLVAGEEQQLRTLLSAHFVEQQRARFDPVFLRGLEAHFEQHQLHQSLQRKEECGFFSSEAPRGVKKRL